MTEELYEDFDQLVGDAKLMRDAMRHLWMGDPELVKDEHWEAYTDFGRKMGLNDE